MRKLPKISIVTATLNQGKFIEDAIKSVLNQNYPNFEHIIIDGGSTDGTIEILNKYPHLKWISEKDEGQSDALNKGFKMATGEIIGWLNTDEVYLPNAFYYIGSAFREKKVDIIYGDYISVRNGKEKYYRSISHFRNVLIARQYVNTVTMFFSKKIIDENNLLDINLHLTMDKEFLLRLEKKNYSFYYLNKPIGKFYWHDQNKSTAMGDIQTKESREIVQEYFFRNSYLLMYLFIWPLKFVLDFLYKILYILRY